MSEEVDIKGIIPAMVTPLTDEGEVNEEALRELTEHLIEGGVHGLFPIGSTGEFYGLDIEQKKKVFEITIDQADDRVTVYGGTGAITTEEAVELAQMAEEVGIDSISVLTPLFVNPNEKELYEHYEAIAKNVDIPVLLYNNPGRTNVNIEPEVAAKLDENFDNICGIKDSSGDMTQTGEYIRRTGDDFAVLAGRDTLILSTLVYGGAGSITATANMVPEIPVAIYEEYQKDNLSKALEAQYELAPLRLAFGLGTFPVVMKEGLNLMGIEAGETLNPVGPMDEDDRSELKSILEDLGAL